MLWCGNYSKGQGSNGPALSDFILSILSPSKKLSLLPRMFVDSPLGSFVTDKTWHASQNFYILMIISPMYRQEFKKMIRLKKDVENKDDQFELDSDDDSTPMLNEAEPTSTQTDFITLSKTDF